MKTEVVETKEVKTDKTVEDTVDGQTEIVPKVATPTSAAPEWDYFDGKLCCYFQWINTLVYSIQLLIYVEVDMEFY